MANIFLILVQQIKLIHLSEKNIDGKRVKVLKYNMSEFMRSKVANYKELLIEGTGKLWELKEVSTPFLPEDTRDAESRRPMHDDDEDAIMCPWCRHTFKAQDALSLEDRIPVKSRSKSKSLATML